jgi:hypothetical protein
MRVGGGRKRTGLMWRRGCTSGTVPGVRRCLGRTTTRDRRGRVGSVRSPLRPRSPRELVTWLAGLDVSRNVIRVADEMRAPTDPELFPTFLSWRHRVTGDDRYHVGHELRAVLVMSPWRIPVARRGLICQPPSDSWDARHHPPAGGRRPLDVRENVRFATTWLTFQHGRRPTQGGFSADAPLRRRLPRRWIEARARSWRNPSR